MKPAYLMLPARHTQTTAEDGSKSPVVSSLRKCTCLLIMIRHIATFTQGVCNRCQVNNVASFGYQVCLLIPGGLAHPAKGESCICADLDGGCFCLSDSLLHWLHQILGIMDQHLCGLVTETFGNEAVSCEITTVIGQKLSQVEVAVHIYSNTVPFQVLFWGTLPKYLHFLLLYSIIHGEILYFLFCWFKLKTQIQSI